jgi:alkylhydroperoxidase family enzyme
MPRLRLVPVSEMTAEQREQYDRFPSNLTRGLLLAESRLARALPNLANALRASGLDPKIREGAILRVASLCDSAYERMQHVDQALRNGWTREELEAIESGQYTSFDAPEANALRFIDECVMNIRVSDETFAGIQRFFSGREIATLLLLAGHYMMVARFIATLDIELDDAPDQWLNEH